MAQSSTTIRVYGAKTLTDCMNALSMFGEIAKIDVTQAESSGYSTATFFDVRSAQCALEQLGERLAVPASAAEQDYRALTAPFEVGPTHYQLFGEVADLRALPNGCLGVEFYDIRSLQRALGAVEGSHPMPVSEIQAGILADAAPMMLAPGLAPPPPPGFTDLAPVQEAKDPYSSDGGSTQDTDEKEAPHPTTRAKDVGAVNKSSGGTERWRAGAVSMKPVAPDEFASLELDLDKIAAGEDDRTTVMLRKISKSKTQADLVMLLGQCGLAGRYTFLYMPYDKRRNSHCRFAFVDFVTPQDVWQLETSLRMFRKLSKNGGVNVDEQLAVVSYARLQGRQQLLQHFGTAAVMHEKDVSRRPQFMSDQMVTQFLLHAGQDSFKMPASSPSTGTDEDDSNEPMHIPLPVGAVGLAA